MCKNVTYNRRTQFNFVYIMKEICFRNVIDSTKIVGLLVATGVWLRRDQEKKKKKTKKKKKKLNAPRTCTCGWPHLSCINYYKNSKFPYTAFQWSFFHILKYEWIALMFEHWTEVFFSNSLSFWGNTTNFVCFVLWTFLQIGQSRPGSENAFGNGYRKGIQNSTYPRFIDLFLKL